jgi:hypothetical protein
MVPKYTVHNRYMNMNTTVTVDGFDARSVSTTVPHGAAAYVQSVHIDGVEQTASRCYFDFYDTFRVGADIVITVTSKTAANSCGASLPHSISTGGFETIR